MNKNHESIEVDISKKGYSQAGGGKNIREEMELIKGVMKGLGFNP